MGPTGVLVSVLTSANYNRGHVTEGKSETPHALAEIPLMNIRPFISILPAATLVIDWTFPATDTLNSRRVFHPYLLPRLMAISMAVI